MEILNNIFFPLFLHFYSTYTNINIYALNIFFATLTFRPMPIIAIIATVNAIVDFIQIVYCLTIFYIFGSTLNDGMPCIIVYYLELFY